MVHSGSHHHLLPLFFLTDTLTVENTPNKPSILIRRQEKANRCAKNDFKN